MFNSILYCKCQECMTVFKIKNNIINSLILEHETQSYDNFLNNKINCVHCKKCKSDLTFETKMIIYDRTDKFAIYVDPTKESNIDDSIPDFITEDGFKYRKVTYQAEAIEKTRIFRDGLNDYDVEYIKILNFSDDEALPFEDKNIVYYSSDGDTYTFHAINHLNKITGIQIIDVSDMHLKKLPDDDKSKWNVVNRYTIENYLK